MEIFCSNLFLLQDSKSYFPVVMVHVLYLLFYLYSGSVFINRTPKNAHRHMTILAMDLDQAVVYCHLWHQQGRDRM